MSSQTSAKQLLAKLACRLFGERERERALEANCRARVLLWRQRERICCDGKPIAGYPLLSSGLSSVCLHLLNLLSLKSVPLLPEKLASLACAVRPSYLPWSWAPPPKGRLAHNGRQLGQPDCSARESVQVSPSSPPPKSHAPFSTQTHPPRLAPLSLGQLSRRGSMFKIAWPHDR